MHSHEMIAFIIGVFVGLGVPYFALINLEKDGGAKHAVPRIQIK
jgi:hypothetical protein